MLAHAVDHERTQDAARGAAAEPPEAPRRGRDSALDLLRAVALARVVVWHTVAAAWMTVFAAIPVMFFVAGTLLGTSSERSHASVVLRRARRLLLPLWVYGAVVASVGAYQASADGSALALDLRGLLRGLSWVFPVVDPWPSDWHAGWLSSHLWYLRAYLWVVVLAPVLGLFARKLIVSVPIFLLLIAQVEAAREVALPGLQSGETRGLAGDLVTYGMFAVLGMAYRDARRLPHRAVLAAGALACGAGAAAYAHLAGLPGGTVNGSYAALALTGMAWLFAAGAAERPLRAFADIEVVRRATATVSKRALTIYLWHPAAIVLSFALLDGPTDTPGADVVALTLALTGVAVVAVGFVEDIASGRWRPNFGRLHVPTAAAFAPPIVVALALAMPLLAEPLVAGPAAASMSIVRQHGNLPPPSDRSALTADDFSGRGEGRDQRPIRLKDGRMPARQLQRALERWRKANPGITSVAVALEAGGRSWEGVATAKGEAPFAVEDRMAILSLTKTFTAALTLGAAEAGLLDLEAPVPAVPGLRVPRRARAITPHQLLQHTSGLLDYRFAPGYDPNARPTPHEALALSLRAPLQSPPGTEVRYANSNYLYLGLVLEQVTGHPYDALVANLTSRVGLDGIKALPSGPPGWVGHASGGVHATMGDLARWADALFTPGRVLPPARLAQLTTLDDRNLGLGTWPLCPCWTDTRGTKRYTAIGHHVGYGGVFHDPAGMSVVIRLDPPSEETLQQVESLHQLLVAVLRR